MRSLRLRLIRSRGRKFRNARQQTFLPGCDVPVA
jgi:hypothetical protein